MIAFSIIYRYTNYHQKNIENIPFPSIKFQSLIK